MGNKYSLNPVFFGVIVVALASVLVVTIVSQYALASLIKGQAGAGLFGGNGGNGGNGGLADIDIAEAEEAGNATMAGAANQTTPSGNTTAVEFLSIQNAKSGSISQINETAYTLELNNVANDTIQFSDRPERIVESISTTDFIGSWTAGPNSFESDVPNDALIVENTQTGKLETAIIESFNPMYDVNTNALTYTITGEN
jgi:hypothetical protein